MVGACEPWVVGACEPWVVGAWVGSCGHGLAIAGTPYWGISDIGGLPSEKGTLVGHVRFVYIG